MVSTFLGTPASGTILHHFSSVPVTLSNKGSKSVLNKVTFKCPKLNTVVDTKYWPVGVVGDGGEADPSGTVLTCALPGPQTRRRRR